MHSLLITTEAIMLVNSSIIPLSSNSHNFTYYAHHTLPASTARWLRVLKVIMLISDHINEYSISHCVSTLNNYLLQKAQAIINRGFKIL